MREALGTVPSPAAHSPDDRLSFPFLSFWFLSSFLVFFLLPPSCPTPSPISSPAFLDFIETVQ